MSTNYIKQITDTAGTTHDLMESVDTRIFRATCTSGKNDTEKVAILEDDTGYSLTTGVKVAVYFRYGNSALSPTLKVTHGTDAAKTIAYPDSELGLTYGGVLASWGSYEVVNFVYDGSVWVCCGSALGIYKAYNLANSYKGTVTSVGLSNDTNGGLTITSSPITSSGTIKIKHSNILSSAQTTSGIYPIKIDKNGHISEYGSAVTIPTKTSDLTNDSGFITGETVLIVEQTWDSNLNTLVLNKTWQEIYDANVAVIIEKTGGGGTGYVLLASNIIEGDVEDSIPYQIQGDYWGSIYTYTATLPTDYPQLENSTKIHFFCYYSNGIYTLQGSMDEFWESKNYPGGMPRIQIEGNNLSTLYITELREINSGYEVDCIGTKDGGTSLFRFKSGSASGPFTVSEDEVITTYTYKMTATLSSAGWYRILNFKTVQGVTLDFTIRIPEVNGAGTESAEVHKISYCTTDGAQAIFTKEDSRGDSLSVNKIRRTYGGTIGGEGVWGFDLHYNSSTARTIYVTVLLEGEVSSSDIILENLSSVNDAPSGESIYPEKTLAQRTEGDITSLCSLTKSSGSSTAKLTEARRRGNVISLKIDFTTSAGISSGGDIWVGTFNGPKPICGANSMSYNGQRVLVCRMNDSGGITMKYAYGSSNLSSGSTPDAWLNYLTE